MSLQFEVIPLSDAMPKARQSGERQRIREEYAAAITEALLQGDAFRIPVEVPEDVSAQSRLTSVKNHVIKAAEMLELDNLEVRTRTLTLEDGTSQPFVIGYVPPTGATPTVGDAAEVI